MKATLGSSGVQVAFNLWMTAGVVSLVYGYCEAYQPTTDRSVINESSFIWCARPNCR